jgi:hypothetical protein
VTSSQFNSQIRDNETWLKGALTQLNVTSDSAKAQITPALVGARAVRSASLSLTNATVTPVSMTAADEFDSNAFHDPAVNSSRITIPASMGGYYLIGGWAAFDNNATGRRLLRLYVNGTTVIAGNQTAGVASDEVGISALYQMAAADYVELHAYQNSGAGLNLTSAVLWIHRIAST